MRSVRRGPGSVNRAGRAGRCRRADFGPDRVAAASGLLQQQEPLADDVRDLERRSDEPAEGRNDLLGATRRRARDRTACVPGASRARRGRCSTQSRRPAAGAGRRGPRARPCRGSSGATSWPAAARSPPGAPRGRDADRRSPGPGPGSRPRPPARATPARRATRPAPRPARGPAAWRRGWHLAPRRPAAASTRKMSTSSCSAAIPGGSGAAEDEARSRDRQVEAGDRQPARGQPGLPGGNHLPGSRRRRVGAAPIGDPPALADLGGRPRASGASSTGVLS